jgi:hypothetical protein
MSVDPRRFVLIFALGLVAAWPPAAQPVYKCGRSAEPTYSDRPCSHRVVDTTEAPVPAGQSPTWVEQQRVVARSLRRMRGESAAHFAARRRRAAMPESDREECERLDTRIPVEQARTTMPEPAEASAGQAALRAARRRFARLRC